MVSGEISRPPLQNSEKRRMCERRNHYAAFSAMIKQFHSLST